LLKNTIDFELRYLEDGDQKDRFEASQDVIYYEQLIPFLHDELKEKTIEFGLVTEKLLDSSKLILSVKNQKSASVTNLDNVFFEIVLPASLIA